MHIKQKTILFIILFITSLIFSKILFFTFNDIEGPNLLIILITTFVIYFLSLASYLFNLFEIEKFLFSVLIQITISIFLYYLMVL